MDIISRISELRKIIRIVKQEGKTVGLVPTMGALHEGHLALIRESRAADGFTVVSIFINPAQFGPNEDYERYPRNFDSDAVKCEQAGVNLIFAPPVEEMYPEGFGTYVNVEGITEKLEGVYRPGHFKGVATIVLKLFAAVEPNRAYFGLKDHQQLKVIQKMVRDLNVKIEIMPVPTVREADGVAISSRNALLNSNQRHAATVLYRALITAREAVSSGEKDAAVIRRKALDVINTEPLASVDYVALVNPETLEDVQDIKGQALVALAVRIGNVRLIDNMLIGDKSG